MQKLKNSDYVKKNASETFYSANIAVMLTHKIDEQLFCSIEKCQLCKYAILLKRGEGENHEKIARKNHENSLNKGLKILSSVFFFYH